MNGVDQIGVVQPGWEGTAACFVIKPPFDIERPSLLQSTIDVLCVPSPFARGLGNTDEGLPTRVWGFGLRFPKSG